MNCQLCQKISDEYRSGKLSRDMKTQVETHLGACEKCTESYRLLALAERVIIHEKEHTSNPFLATRIMARLENQAPITTTSSPLIIRVLRPTLITVSMAAAIFYGIVVGNIYQPESRNNTIPVELALSDDSAIESVDILSLE